MASSGKTKNELLADVESLGRQVADLKRQLADQSADDTAQAARFRIIEQFRLLADSLPVLVSYVDSNLRYRFNNKCYETWFGYSRSEVYGKHVKEVIGEAGYEAVLPHINAVLSGRQVDFETSIMYEKGDRREVYCNYVPDLMDGKVRGFFVLVQDITERKHHQKVLEKTLRSLAEAQRIAHLGNWDWDIEHNELLWSDEIYRIFGLTPQQFGATYEAFLDRVHPQDRDFVNRCVDEALRRQQPYSIDHRIIRPDGSIRIVHEQAEVFFNQQGEPNRMIGTVQDVTQAKHAEQALQERLRFEHFLSEFSAGFINLPVEKVTEELEHGLQGIVRLMDLDLGAVLQYVEGKIIVTHFWGVAGVSSLNGFVVSDRLPWLSDQLRRGLLQAYGRLPDDLPEQAKAERRFCETRGFKSIICIPLQVGGSILGAVLFVCYLKYREWPADLIQRLKLVGEIFATALIREQNEEHARGLRAELSHVARVVTLGELSASLAHELNQPLTAILMNAQAAQRFLAEETPDIKELREILNDIITDDKRAGEIIHKLRTLLKKDERKLESIQFNLIAREVIELLRNDAMLRGVTLDMQIAPDLPEVRGDRVQLQQVLMNLILNASDVVASQEPDNRKVIVRTDLHDPANIKVTVADSGPGLPENAQRLFEPFYTTKANGLGMGLAISRSIVESHGGRIWAENNPDRGACFSFTVQVAVEE
ncbi:MAG: PAS domain S-box protein [Candidatus Abyssobacteria bacterium SURF_5]|uniref:histidine kinase n=1 Tax=Abyssobacteria bacterium (strain SURF_5) TaxID=2093360 RepID=A0A3A4NHN5_ABYX5|nr:MAG: PAS domain S-box protein [Candidatus Abyssubacteria bacterium SURF_5]